MRQTLINGRWPIILPDHRADFHEERPWWEAARLADMYAHLKPGMVVYDIGAEEGDLTALYASWGCHVIAAEPSPGYWPTIRDTFDMNGLAMMDEVRLFLSDTPTTFPFVIPPVPYEYSPGFSVRSERPDIPQTKIDYTIVPIDAITIDVEGDELAVLRGGEGVLDGAGPIVWVSIHEPCDFDACTPSKVHAYMREFGYKDQFLAYDHEWHVRFWKP